MWHAAPPRGHTIVLHVQVAPGWSASAVAHGPFPTEAEATAFAVGLRRRTPAADRIELLACPPPPFPASRAARTATTEELACRLLARLRAKPEDFAPERADATRPPAALFPLACIEAPALAQATTALLDRLAGRWRAPRPATLGQLLLDVPHDAAGRLRATRWPALWVTGDRVPQPDSRPRRAHAAAARAVLAWRLRRGRWPRPAEPAGLEAARTERSRPPHPRKGANRHVP